jgi:hypothetical protein
VDQRVQIVGRHGWPKARLDSFNDNFVLLGSRHHHQGRHAAGQQHESYDEMLDHFQYRTRRNLEISCGERMGLVAQ